MAQKTGRVTLKINGGQLASKRGAQLQTGGVEREPDIDDQGKSYYSEKIVGALVTATIIHTSQTDLVALRGFAGGTLNFETDTGQVWTVPDAFTQTIGPLQNGEVEVTFGGDPAETQAGGA